MLIFQLFMCYYEAKLPNLKLKNWPKQLSEFSTIRYITLLILVDNKAHAATNINREMGYLLSFVYFLFGWHASAASLPLGDIILAKLACPLNDIIALFTS